MRHCLAPMPAPAKRALPVGLAWAILLLWVMGLAGCATSSTTPPTTAVAASRSVDAAVRQALAPTGILRVGVYPGSPTSLVKAADGLAGGIAHDLGRGLSRDLGVPVQMVEFARVAQVLDALRSGQVDFTFTNATESRAREMDFTAPLVRLELGYLVPAPSSIARIEDIDRNGVRVGVAQGSTSQSVLGVRLRQATVVGTPSLDVARAMLGDGRIDAFATNKGILHELSDGLAGSRILDGRWGLETMAIAIPKGREAARPWLQRWADAVLHDGRLALAVQRSGLRGVAHDPNGDLSYPAEKPP